MRPMQSMFRTRRNHVPSLNMASMPDLIFTVLFFFMIVTHMRSDEVKVRLDALNPGNVLKRGYSYVCDKDGKAIESVMSVNKGDKVSIVLSDGKILSEVKDIENKDEGGNINA